MSWSALEEELQHWEAPAELWWRDDDATHDTPALRQLLTLASEFQVPVHLAVIPQQLHTSLDYIRQPENRPCSYVLQHGINHQSHATEGMRKVELGGSYPLNTLCDDLTAGRQRLAGHFEEQYLDMLVPPWNRLSEALLPRLKEIGYEKLSVLGPRPDSDNPQHIRQLNVHLDIINWKERCFAADEQVISKLTRHLQLKRTGQIDATEPCGLMTHHLDHDPACWDFLQRFFTWCHEHEKIRWLAGPDLLSR